jgi:hypothetical protein
MNYVRFAQDYARRLGSPDAEMNFAALRARLDRIRADHSPALPAAERSIAVIARDFDNKGQNLLARAIETSGFTPWEVDFRHTYVSSPRDAARQPTPQSLSHWLTYMCGLVAASPNRSVVLVSGAFELAGPLQDLVTREGGGHAILAYFQRLLDKRWIDNGLLDGRLRIEFVNLEQHARELLGVDLRELARQTHAARRGPSLPM